MKRDATPAWVCGPNTRWLFETNWPPGFVPQLSGNPGELKRREAAVRGRATQIANGHTGSIRGALSKRTAPAQPKPQKQAIAPTLMKRPEAQRLKLSRYFTGSACVAGHTAQRYTSTSACCECMKVKWRARDAKRSADKRAADALMTREAVPA